MHITCTICSDLFCPSSEIYTTECGHIFHYHCLMNWIERSKTCPQCRRKVTEKTIYRVYFNIANTDSNEDLGTLRNKYDNLQFQMTLKDKDVKNLNEKYKKIKLQNTSLREEVAELESKIRVHESAVNALKDQVSYFKSKAKDNTRLTDEIVRLKNKIKDMENMQIAITGSRTEVMDMIRNEHNVESLALLAVTLKKSLLDTERHKRDTDNKLKLSQNEITRYKRECTKYECENSELRKELEYLRTNTEKEKQYLKQKITELEKKISSGNALDITNTSLKRIIAESPVNFNRKPQLNPSDDIIDLNETSSPSISEKVKRIKDSDSPYLPVKSSSVGFLNAKFTTKPLQSGKEPRLKTSLLENIKISTHSRDVWYNGLGGSSKEDIFPSPKPRQTGLKRHKSSSSVSSSKFRRLAPIVAKNSQKVTNFFSQD